MSLDLSGKVAIVTGGSSGIGRATAVAFAKLGVKVAVAARSEDKIQEVVDEIKSFGGTALGIKTDVRQRDQVKALAAQTVSALGPVDILVNSAGLWYFTMMTSLKEDAWEEMVDINCKGVLNSIGAVLAGMVEQKSGHIINISSDAGRRPFDAMAVYGATKYFVEGLTTSMRREVAKHGIRMTSVQPGDVDTPGCLRPPVDKETHDKFEDPGIKVLTADDVARAVVYAASQPLYVAVNEVLVQPQENPL